MRLYHGTDKESAHNIQKHGVDLTYSRQDTDFGHAFYLTNQKGLAKAWANRNFFTAGAVLTFEADLDSLSVKLFESINDEWKEAVFRARVLYQDVLRYDCVVGPIADGSQLKTLINDYMSGTISKEMLLRQISERKIGTQYAFKTAKAISRLAFIEKEVY